MNTIRIPWAWSEGNVNPAYVDKFIYDKFRLQIEKDKTFFDVDVTNGTEAFDITEKGIVYHVQHNHVTCEDMRDDKRYLKCQGMLIMADIIRRLTDYIMNYQRDRKEVHPVPKKYSREHRLSTSQNKIYLLDDIIKYVHDNYVSQGVTHKIQCECWEVRGHYRTYKNGKQIWINSYKKGKKRNEIKPQDKTYYLYKEACDGRLI